MNKYYYYYILIFIIILIFSKTQLKQSEIKLIFKGKGHQQIVYNSFQYSPSEVIVNGELKQSCKKTCDLEKDDNNEVIIKFNTQINTCANMFRD